MEQIILSSIPINEFKEFISNILDEKLKGLITPSRNNENEAQFLSRQQVCDLLKISLPTLNSFTKREIIKGYRVGRRVLYKYSDIEISLKEISSLRYKSSSSRK